MDIKNLIACLVFLLIWRITLSQQVSETKDPRMKIYHENHIDDMKKQSSLTNHQNERIKKFIELKPALGPVNFMNKNAKPEKKTQSKVFRIKPTVPNQRKPFTFVAKNQDDLKLNNDGLNEANVINSELNEEDVTNVSQDASAVSTDESTPVKGTDPQVENKLINKFSKIIPYNNTRPSNHALFIDVPTSQNLFTTKSQITKPPVTELKLQLKEKQNPESKQDDIQIDAAYITDEAIYNKTLETNSGQAKLYLMDNDDDKEKPKKHPFLDAIQNDRYLMCSPQDAPNASVIADTTSIEDIEIRFHSDRLSESPKATPDQAVHLIIPHTGNKDEVEYVTIKSCTFKELSDIPQVTLEPEFKANNIPVPYTYNQVLKSMELDNQLNHRTPDEQIIEKKDKKNVYTYNSYYQRPTGYWYGYNYRRPYQQNYQDGYCIYYQPSTTYNANCCNHASRAIPGIQNYWNKVYGTNRDVNRNKNAYYGCSSAQPQQLQNYWYKNYDTTKGIDQRWLNEKIHRKWMNTEFSTKGKNAFKKISDDNLRNRFLQSGPMQNARGFM